MCACVIAYLYQLVDVGGWDDGALAKLKSRVTDKKSCKVPVEIMDALVEEIERMVREEGVEFPRTPVLPLRKGGGGGGKKDRRDNVEM